MDALRPAARFGAHTIVLLLAAVWATAGTASLATRMFDLGRPRVGDALYAFTDMVHLRHVAPDLAYALTWVKIVIGGFLLGVVLMAIGRYLRRAASDDALFDVGLFVAAVASVVAALPHIAVGGVALQGAIGELMLCLIASGLASFGRGTPQLIPFAHPRAQWRLVRISRPRRAPPPLP